MKPILKNLSPEQQQKANARFNALSKPQQRVLLAREAIHYEETGLFEMVEKNYIDVFHKNVPNMYGTTPVSARQVRLKDRILALDQVVLEGQDLCCKVCHLGGAVLLALRKGALKMPVLNTPSCDAFKAPLLELFTPMQAKLMETAYEKDFSTGQEVPLKLFATAAGERELERAIAFGEMYKYPRDRSIAIWKNVIKNNGVFKP